MRLESLTCKGVLAFDAAVTVDLTSLPPGSVVAVVGPNGEGKTTLVETWPAACWRQMPYRDKALLDYATGRDSFVEAVLTMDTHRYRSRVNIDGVRRATEAVLERDGEILSDGKVTDFDAKVRGVFPTLRSVLASAFCAQNRRGSFAEADRKGRKELFADFLGLDDHERMAGIARGRAADAGRRLDVERARYDEIAKRASDDVETDLQARENALQAAVGALELRRQEIRAARHAIATERPSVVADAARHTQAEADLARIAGELATNDAERTRLTKARGDVARQMAREQERAASAFQVAIGRLIARGRKAEDERDKAQSDAEQRFEALKKDREERIANNRKLLTDAEAIRARAHQAERAETLLATRRAELREADEALQKAQEKAAECEREALLVSDAPSILDRVEDDAQLLTTVPCGGRGEFAGCSFLQRAIEAAGRLPELRADVDTYEKACAQRDDAERVYLQAKSMRTDAYRAVSEIEDTLKALNGASKQAAALDVAEAKIAEHERAIAEAECAWREAHNGAASRFVVTCEELRSEAVRAKVSFHADLGEAADDELAEQESLDVDLRAVTVTRESLERQQATVSQVAAETALAASRLAQLDAEDAQHARAWAESEATRGRLEAEQAALTVAWQAFKTHHAELTTLTAAIGVLEQDLVEWQALARVFHRDGLPTLLIAAAGPEVAELTNDLLEAAGYTRFRVDLVTQEAKISGKGLKETFELKILDADRGGEPRDLTDLSGGQRVIVDEALKAALALYQRRHGAHPIETCVRDEAASALDADNRDRYVPMLRRLMALGGFHLLLYVTHDEALAAHADAQIQVRHGTARLVHAPFNLQEAA